MWNNCAILEIWEIFREFVPMAKRDEIALSLMAELKDSAGLEKNDFVSVLGEDQHLTNAFNELFESHDDDDDGYYEDF